MRPIAPVARERAPRRARYLLPRETPRRAELLAVSGLVLLLAGALFATVTVVVAALCQAVGKATRWHPWWLTVPAGCGLVWALAIGPSALTGFAAASRAVAALLSQAAAHGMPMSRLAMVPAVIARHLASQCPVALVSGAGVAAFGRWLTWLHTNEGDAHAPRPGLVSLLRRRWNLASLRAGGVVSRDGVNLGVEPASGRPAGLSWQQARGGVLVTGARPDEVTATGFDFVRAAVRRRSAVVVADLTGTPRLRQALAELCEATGAPLGDVTAATADDVLDRRAVGLAVLDLSPDRPGVVADLVSRLCAGHTAVDGGLAPDTLLWVNGCPDLGPGVLAKLAAAGHSGALAWVLGTTVPAAAAGIAAQASVCVVHRVADTTLADRLAARCGTRLVPAPGAGDGVAGANGLASQATAFGMMAVPRVTAASLTALGEGEVLLVGDGTPARTAVRAHAVDAR